MNRVDAKLNELSLTNWKQSPFKNDNLSIATLGLHLGFSAKLRIWQVSACKMEPQSGTIITGPASQPSTELVICSGACMVRRPSCRRKNILMRFIFLIVIIVHAIRDAGIEAAVFTKDANEDNDDLKTGHTLKICLIIMMYYVIFAANLLGGYKKLNISSTKARILKKFYT